LNAKREQTNKKEERDGVKMHIDINNLDL